MGGGMTMTHVWMPDLGNGKYKNPIIFADYSDPDVIRVGEDYFMVASSFNLSPCLPVLHSKDLVHWKLINHVSETFPFTEYERPQHGQGVWAPSIRYHQGEFFVFFGAPDEGIMMSKTKDPFGDWSPLHLVKRVKGWIDPCPFWDDDGQAYLISAFARSRIGFKSILHLSRMKPDGTKLLDDGAYIFDGNLHHETIEGPKMYKRNGYYYIFAPAGGVKTGWQTILRSKSIYGPYEDKIVLHQGDTEINGPHQGGWIDTPSGQDWFIHFQDRGAYGRITHLQPMQWVNDWPQMGTNIQDGLGEPVLEHKKPDVGDHVVPYTSGPQTSDDFESATLGLQWQWQANKGTDWFKLLPEESKLRLWAIPLPEDVKTLYHTPNILMQKFSAPAFTATAKMTLHAHHPEDKVGLLVMGVKYAGLILKPSDDNLAIDRLDGGLNRQGVAEETTTNLATFDHQTIFLRVHVHTEAQCEFSYSLDGEKYHQAGELFKATPGKWIGATLGLCCINSSSNSSMANKTNSGYVDIDWFKIE